MNSLEYKKAYKITTQLIDNNIKNLRYIPMAFIGIYATCIRHYNLPTNDDVVNGVKDGIFDFLSEEVLGGVEATFTTDGYNWWYGLKSDSFDYQAGFQKKDIKYKSPPPTDIIFEYF